MFQTASGIKISDLEKMKEEFQAFDHCIRFNLSFEKIHLFLDEFIDGLQEPLFLVLQIPLSQDEEEKLRNNDTNPFHQKVCYLDGQSKVQIRTILQHYGELLLNDGMSQLAIASHVTNEEMFIQKYKLIDIFCSNPSVYFDLLNKYGTKQTDNLVTAWDTFSLETPGETKLIKVNDRSVYDVYDELIKMGMYDAKIIEG